MAYNAVWATACARWALLRMAHPDLPALAAFARRILDGFCGPRIRGLVALGGPRGPGRLGSTDAQRGPGGLGLMRGRKKKKRGSADRAGMGGAQAKEGSKKVACAKPWFKMA